MTSARGAAAVVLLLLAAASPAAAALYRWTDTEGAIHYTADVESIPEARRATAVAIGHPGPQAAPPPSPAPAGTAVPFTAGGPVVVDARLNGVSLRLLVDTGSDRTLISPAALARTGIDTTGGRPVRITGVTGVAETATLVSIPSLDVAGARIGPIGVVAYAVPDEGIDGLLGRDVLDAFVVTFDPTAGRALLTPR